MDELERRILAFLNNGGDPAQLQARLSVPEGVQAGGVRALFADVHQADVTGDGVDDVVLEVTLRTDRPDAKAILALVCRDGSFRTRFSERIYTTEQVIPSLQAIVDMNGNSVADIVFSEEAYGATGNSSTTFFIVEWDGQEFAQLVSTDAAPGAGMVNLYFVGNQKEHPRAEDVDTMFPDTDGNGTREIVLVGEGSSSSEDQALGPQERLHVDTWAWNGEGFTLRSAAFAPPVYRVEAILDGDSATLKGDDEAALAFYQQAVFDEALAAGSAEMAEMDEDMEDASNTYDERSRLNAYGRYRILLIHALEGNADAADIVYRTLKEKIRIGSAGYPYVALADEFWQGLQTTGSVSGACQRARAYAAAHQEEILVPLGSAIYGQDYEDYTPEGICPFD